MGGTSSVSLEGLALDPLVTWRHHAPPSLLYRSTHHRKAQAARACVTSGRCSARRHWQQAASNDARAGPALHRDKCRRANTGPRSLARVRCSHRVKRLRDTRKRESPPARPDGDVARVLAHREPWGDDSAPSGGHGLRFRIGGTQRQVTTATPFRAAMAQDKEPLQSFHWTTRERTRQERMAQIPGRYRRLGVVFAKEIRRASPGGNPSGIA